MKIMTSCVASAIALLAATGAYAADTNKADKADVSWVFNDNVAPAEQQAYEAAIKSLNKCMGEHGAKHQWAAWTHETGNTYAYSYVAGPYTWADIDKMHAEGKACEGVWRSEGNAHLKSETSAFLIAKPEFSHMPKKNDATPALIGVTDFWLKPTREADDAFTDAVKKITAAAEKSNWSYYYTMYQVRAAGDKDAPDYVLTSPHATWADYGAGANPSVWKMVEAADGKQEADAIRKSLDDALKDSSSHVDSYSADLTYTPSK